MDRGIRDTWADQYVYFALDILNHITCFYIEQKNERIDTRT